MKNLFKRFINFFVSFFEKKRENKKLRQVNRNLNFLAEGDQDFGGAENSVSVQIQSPEITS